MSPTAESVRLRRVAAEDCDRLFAWQTEPGIRRHFRNLEPPSRAEHEAWFAARLRRDDPLMWIIEAGSDAAGYVRLDPLADDPEAEVSILLGPAWQGCGIAPVALRLLRETVPERRLVATIAAANRASVQAFLKAGFREAGPCRYASEPVRGAKTAALGDVAVVYCDSAAALGELEADGLSPEATVRTSSPYLLEIRADRCVALEASISPETFEAFKFSIRPFIEQIYDCCYGFADGRDYARTIARASATFQPTVFKAACLDERDFSEPRLVARLATGDAAADAVLNPRWDALLGANPALRIVDVATPLPRAAGGDVARPARWLFRGPEYLGFRLAMVLSRCLPSLFRGGATAYVLKENELLHETAAHLALRGVRLERLTRPVPAATGKDVAGPIGDACWHAIERILRAHVARFVCEPAAGPVIAMTMEVLREHVQRQDAARAAMAHRLRPAAGRGVVLTNYPGSPEEYGLFKACEGHGMPLVAFQHGISRELNDVHGDFGVENSSAHLTLVYNETAKRHTDATQFHHGQARAVGYPTMGRRLKRLPRWCFKRSEDVLFISTNVYRGNVNTIAGTFSDHDNCQLEQRIITKVLNRLPHRVSYKGYPWVLRYADPDPALATARASANISVIEEDTDVRYFLRSASVLVTSRATSTTGWCILGGQPLCFLDVPQQMPLAADVKDAFRDSFFYFDLREADALEALRVFLSQPLAAIRKAWKEKAPAREEFISRHVDAPTPSAGAAAARAILDHPSGFAGLAGTAFTEPDRYPTATRTGHASEASGKT